QWDLVCSRSVLAQSSQTALVLGVIIGAVSFTMISDNIGRKPVFFASHFFMVIVGVAVTLTDNYYVFLFLRLLTGAFQQGILLCGFIMACELFSAKHRTFAGTVGEVTWGVAASILPLFAWAFHNWIHFQLFISLTGLLVLPLYWLVRCSVRIIWLYANNRIDEAEKIIKHAAKLNKITFPDKFLQHQALVQKHGRRSRTTSESADKVTSKKEQQIDQKVQTELKVNPTSRNEMVVTLVYYGLILTTAQLAGDRYLNGFFNALVEVPAYLTSYFALAKFGRRKPLMAYFAIAGLPLFISPFIPKQTEVLNIMLYLVGKFGITGAFGIVFLYASEMFPTNLRGQALGICSMAGRLGNFIATFVSYLIEKHPNVPSLAFGSLSIISAFLVFLLPETHNRPLPDTIEEIEAWKEKPSKIHCWTGANVADKKSKDLEED
ncbi:hypothetical protein HELRODRAFT_89451, partial [Helobdella robusta]|uniref:Major facilitator superfamily (MFS) profile domain-containing protein n=1 Tax=Helobdella robusta TaxID=6412 RepID=T1G7D0_HELRO